MFRISDNFDSKDERELFQSIKKAVNETAVFDIHTHLYPPQFEQLNLWGIDELLNYHYLFAEFFRYSKIKPDEFFALEQKRRADLIWQKLFVENTPLSEATSGVIGVLSELGLDAGNSDLKQFREYSADQDAFSHLDNVLRIANISDIVMTNDPLDDEERSFWDSRIEIDSRFHAALRLDGLLNNWTEASESLIKQGYEVSKDLTGKTIEEIRRFFEVWCAKIKPLYLAASLSEDFNYPENSPRGIILQKAVLPFCRENKIPLSLMIGVHRKVNPALGAAGDGLGRADVSAISRICAENPDVDFLATFLSRENQHELCVAARKFSNLMPFGCWWFLNNPSIIYEITNERLELLGTSFIPQHSDARILDQLIYKWKHSRNIITDSLYQSYRKLAGNGFPVSEDKIQRDVKKLFYENFTSYVNYSK